MVASRLVNRNIIAGRGRTSMRLEPELWDALRQICDRERLGVGDLIRTIEQRGHAGGRTSAVRVYILEYFRALAAERHEPCGVVRNGAVDPSLSSTAA
jgi:predicted DNA-binding ribbon-helix-helix protein